MGKIKHGRILMIRNNKLFWIFMDRSLFMAGGGGGGGGAPKRKGLGKQKVSERLGK